MKIDHLVMKQIWHSKIQGASLGSCHVGQLNLSGIKLFHLSLFKYKAGNIGSSVIPVNELKS